MDAESIDVEPASYDAAISRLGLIYLPVDPWARAYLSAASLYAITSAINLSKAMRDEHEASRDGEAKLGRILADHDPFRAA